MSNQFKFPSIISATEENGIKSIEFANLDKSIWNAIRRTILSDIPVYGFEQEKCIMLVNNTQFHDQIITSNLMQIPVNETDLKALDDYEVYVNVKNATDNILYITTKDFRIRHKTTHQEMDDARREKIFPIDPLTGDYILFCILQSSIDSTIQETLEFHCPFSVVSAGVNSSYAVASISNGRYSFDVDSAEKHWQKMLEGFVAEKKEEEFIKMQRLNFFAKGGLHETFFDTKKSLIQVKTCGVFSNDELIASSVRFILQSFIGFKSSLGDIHFHLLPNEFYMFHSSFPYGFILQYFALTYFSNYFVFFTFDKMHPSDANYVCKFYLSKDIKQNTVLPIFEELVANCIEYFQHFEKIVS
jgi:Mg2+ and Co2+ transporter CorA